MFTPVTSQCPQSGSTKVTGSRGFLSSRVTDQTGCGSVSHPWLIDVSSGQQVKVDLIDFAATVDLGYTQDHSSCNVYGYISEASSGANISICGGLAREREVYTSSSNLVQIQITDLQTRGNGGKFLLKYEGKGIGLMCWFR